MKSKLNFFGLFLLIVAIFPVFFLEPFLSTSWLWYGLISFGLVLATGLSFFKQRHLFPEIVFFTLIVTTLPARLFVMHTTGLRFAGANYLLPIALFLLLLVISRSFRSSITGWGLGKIDTITMLLVIGFGLTSSLALYVWGNFFAKDLETYTSGLPVGHWTLLVLLGIAFALINSTVEEVLSRGFLWTGLNKIFSNVYVTVLVQAIVFGIFHKNGFPSGLTGVIMVFFYSIMLAIVKIRSGGIIAPMICHFISDLSIFGILYVLKP